MTAILEWVSRERLIWAVMAGNDQKTSPCHLAPRLTGCRPCNSSPISGRAIFSFQVPLSAVTELFCEKFSVLASYRRGVALYPPQPRAQDARVDVPVQVPAELAFHVTAVVTFSNRTTWRGTIPLMQALRGWCGPPGVHGTVDTQDTRLGGGLASLSLALDAIWVNVIPFSGAEYSPDPTQVLWQSRSPTTRTGARRFFTP